jgi:environmental stress-induced protein Ves
MIRLIDPAAYRTVPWKNGGGTATDIAADHGDDGEVAWRIGTAAIQKDGPFSDYDGVTRVFTIVEGSGVHLDFAGEGTRTLGRDQPTRFAGAPAPFCRLRDHTSATAFNLMTKDGAFSGDVEIRLGAGGAERLAPADVVALVAIEGHWSLVIDGKETAIPQGWTALVEAGGDLAAASAAGGRAALVTLKRG